VTETELLHGDCLDVLATLPAESIDACVTDPPYELGFMGKHWDASGVAFQVETWAAVARVLKPGAHLLACGGTRTYHHMATAIEKAGFEVRDCLAWLYGSGFPKSLNLGEGLGTALKPAYEPIVLARKPFKGSVKGNVEKHGTGALNIDACRIAFAGEDDKASWSWGGVGKPNGPDSTFNQSALSQQRDSLGRWPANVCLDELAALVLDEQSGELHAPGNNGTDQTGSGGIWRGSAGGPAGFSGFTDSGGASRFYYVAKPSREERDMGCYSLRERSGGEATARTDGTAGLNNPRAGAGRTGGARNFHPTVKPVELMRWLVRLVTPINGTVIDPFLGSGTTGIACRYELRSFIGIEREAEYLEIARRRIDAAAPLFGQSA
jgi:DNA modification methylase